MEGDADKAEVHLVFFDQDTKAGKKLIQGYAEAIGPTRRPNTFFVNMDVKDLIKEYRVDIIVSPANCLGFMDGGIDMVYMQLFPGIQEKVQAAIASYAIETALGRKVLPIGSCRLVATCDVRTPYLACVPTMFLPENITTTRNVYHAMRGLLECCERIRTTIPARVWPNNRVVVAIPCLGTGVGCMSGQQSGEQVAEAIGDHTAGKPFITEEMRARGVDWHPKSLGSLHPVLTLMACPQPNNYANTEINPDARPEDLVKRIELRSATMGYQ